MQPICLKALSLFYPRLFIKNSERYVRKDIERKTGKKILTSENAKNLQNKDTKGLK